MLQIILSGKNESANQDQIDKRGIENCNFAKIEKRAIGNAEIILSIYVCDDTRVNRAILVDWKKEDAVSKSFPGKILAWGEV